jgi:hypothetical protein
MSISNPLDEKLSFEGARDDEQIRAAPYRAGKSENPVGLVADLDESITACGKLPRISRMP